MNKSFPENLKNWNEVIYLRCELIYNTKKFVWNFVSLRNEIKRREKCLGNMCSEGKEIKTRVVQLHNAYVYSTIHKILIGLFTRDELCGRVIRETGFGLQSISRNMWREDTTCDTSS
jgi:hypothetical protein